MQNKHLQIQMVHVGKIIPYWRNPRRNDKTVETLIEVIKQYGFNVPLVIDKNNVVVKGHARLKAAKRLGMEEVPCVVTDADPETIKADRIADNKIQEMSFWDFAALEVEFQKIGEMKFERLFKSEDVKKLDMNFEAPEAYVATSLGDYDVGAGDVPYVEASTTPYVGNSTQNYAENAHSASNGENTHTTRQEMPSGGAPTVDEWENTPEPKAAAEYAQSA